MRHSKRADDWCEQSPAPRNQKWRSNDMEDDTPVVPQWEVAKQALSWRWVPSTALGLAAEDLAAGIATEDDCFNTELTDEELARALRRRSANGAIDAA
jgi:hypothetical protein